MYCFFANVKIKQAKQDWPNLPVLGSHSTKSSSSLEHSADETRSSDVGCACQRKNNGVGKRERREVRKPTNKSIKYLSLCPASHRHYCFSSLKRACGRMENFKLLCSCEWLWVQTNGTGLGEAQWPKVVPGAQVCPISVNHLLQPDSLLTLISIFRIRRGGKGLSQMVGNSRMQASTEMHCSFDRVSMHMAWGLKCMI